MEPQNSCRHTIQTGGCQECAIDFAPICKKSPCNSCAKCVSQNLYGKNGRWLDNDIPKRGWTCIYIHDEGGMIEICEMCGIRHIRYIHTMMHPKYSEHMKVGCICAGYMEGDMDMAELREKKFLSVCNKKSRFINLHSDEWELKNNKAGGYRYEQKFGKFNIVIMQSRYGLKNWIYMINEGQWIHHNKSLNTFERAADVAFEDIKSRVGKLVVV